jgi:hypothetical protein
MSQILHSFFVSMSDPKPPSVNRLYTTGYRGRKILSKEGEAYKAALTACVVAECMVLPWKSAIDAVYREVAWVNVVIGVHTSIFNKSWKPGGLTESGALQSPYKKMDGSNYIKVVEDAIADATGIDDSAHLFVGIAKLDDAFPRVEVGYEILSREKAVYGL